MSLLLDALKEAEARKRESAPAMTLAPATSRANSIDSAVDSHAMPDSVGTLALAEDVHPEPAATRPAPPAPLRAAPTPAETLLAARASRPSPTAARAPAGRDDPKADRPAATPTTMAARPGGALPWLLALAGLLVLLVGGAFLYDAVVNRVPTPYVAPDAGVVETVAMTVPPVRDASSPPPGSSASRLTDASPTRPAGTADTSPPPRRRAGEPAASSRRTTMADAPSPRSRRPGGDSEAQDAPGAGTRDARISISREPAPLDAAWAAQQAGDLDRAEALYRRVLASEQGQVDAQLGLAVIAHARGNDAAARRGYRQVLESAPEHPRAWAGLAELAGEDDAGGIESRLRQLLANRQSGPLHFALGNVLARQERWSDAQQEYFAAATLAPDAPDYAYNVAVALERIGKPAAAMPWYSRALQQAGAGRAVRFDALAARARLEQLQATPP